MAQILDFLPPAKSWPVLPIQLEQHAEDHPTMPQRVERAIEACEEAQRNARSTSDMLARMDGLSAAQRDELRRKLWQTEAQLCTCLNWLWAFRNMGYCREGMAPFLANWRGPKFPVLELPELPE